MTKARRFFLVLASLLAVVVLYLLLWPVAISPQAWTPPPAPPLTGQYQANSLLAKIERLPLGTGLGPEDVALDVEGRIYAGLDDGRIMRLQPNGTYPEVFSNTHGRPLGLIFDPGGNLIVADAIKGLLSIAPDGSVTVLTTEADGVPFGCTNDLDVAADGTIYFTDASSKFPLSNFTADILEHGPNGRLLAYDPKTKATRTILSHLCFANGVAVSPDQSFVLVVETGKYRVHRVWLNKGPTEVVVVQSRTWIGGPKYGRSEIFIDNLPGFPDGISSNGKDKFWLALVTPRDQALDKLLPHPFLRKIVARLPKFLQPAPKRYSFVLGLDANGRVIENLQDGSPQCYAEIANAVERNGALYFGSIGESSVGRYRLPQSSSK
ncbi:MAG TPA: gluconolactonase [Blastocatellia bacterium]|jgi:sugar lactone lactonase YvrE|nr:gluconolactonase [Blastocatellia bacterium]HAF23933.1 gluconolactonase [Blastocatellia bacterium]